MRGRGAVAALALALAVALFVGSSARVYEAGKVIRISQATNYPWQGEVHMTVRPERQMDFTLALRIPSWAQGRPVISDLYTVALDSPTHGWAAGGWDPRLFEACLSRSHTLAQPATASHRYPTSQQMREWVKEPRAFRLEYADGLRATVLMLNGLVQDFTLAARIKGQREPLSTLFHLPPNPNVVYSAALMSKAEETFVTGKAPYPVERTLLTSGLVTAGMTSLAQGGKRLATPHLAVRYDPPKDSTFWRK